VCETCRISVKTLFTISSGLLEYLLPLLPPSLLAAQNNAKSTALHWASVNCHLPIVQKLVEYKEGPGVDLIDIKNAAGRSPLAEAEFNGWDEGAVWLVKMMNIDTTTKEEETSGGDATEEHIPDPETAASGDITVEIEDADGQVAKTTLKDSEASNFGASSESK
jgi:uncharacterized protein